MVSLSLHLISVIKKAIFEGRKQMLLFIRGSRMVF